MSGPDDAWSLPTVHRPPCGWQQETLYDFGLADRVMLCLTDGALGVDLRGAVVLANLPYVPSQALGTLQPEIRRWEPRVAVLAGLDGLAVIRRGYFSSWLR